MRVVVDRLDVVDLVQQAGIGLKLVIRLGHQRQSERSQEHGSSSEARSSSELTQEHSTLPHARLERQKRAALPNPIACLANPKTLNPYHG